MQDGNLTSKQANLVGGFYDSGNNIKFSFSTAYTMTLLSWTVIEYHQKYADIGELDHVKDIIKWGSDYLLKLFVPPNGTSDTILYSQASLMILEHQSCTIKVFREYDKIWDFNVSVFYFLFRLEVQTMMA